MRKVTLRLSDGTSFHGLSFGYGQPVAGEVVFNTAMTGYPECLTDPSYAGQMMVLTFPLVGNYGVPPFTFAANGVADYMEGDHIYASALIVSDYSDTYSHWNAHESLAEWLQREHVPAVTGIDTRALTKRLREQGVMMGQIIFDDMPAQIPSATYGGVNYGSSTISSGVSCSVAWRLSVSRGIMTSIPLTSTGCSFPTDLAIPIRVTWRCSISARSLPVRCRVPNRVP